MNKRAGYLYTTYSHLDALPDTIEAKLEEKSDCENRNKQDSLNLVRFLILKSAD